MIALSENEEKKQIMLGGRLKILLFSYLLVNNNNNEEFSFLYLTGIATTLSLINSNAISQR